MKKVTAKPLREFALGFYDGPHATPPESTDGPIFLRIDNITPDGRLDLSDLRFISEQDFPRWTRRVQIQEDDVVFSYEAALHRYVLIPEGFHGCLGRRLALLRPNQDKVEPAFLLYYFLSDNWRRIAASAVINGATVDRLSLKRVPTLMVRIPELSVQRQIVQILSAYDVLIQNNARRISLLEQAARLLYEEWFVRLRFPGREHTHVIKGIPEGWKSRPLGRCAKFLSGGTPSKSRSEYWDGDIPWVSSGEMKETRIADARLHITAEAVEQGSRLVPPNTILVVVRGMSLAKEFRITMTSRPVAFNQDLKALACEPDVDPVFLFHAIVAQRDQIRDRATEASHGTKKLETAVLTAVPILLSPIQLQVTFRELVDPLNAQWDNLHQQNEKLRSARDLLLPRLMSGEVAV